MKRTFSSYGLVDRDMNYFVPRTELIERAINQLVGENPDKGGHYFTVWASRQRGKSSVLTTALDHLEQDDRFYTAYVPLQIKSFVDDILLVINDIILQLSQQNKINLPKIEKTEDFKQYFSQQNFDRPVILVLDEFDYLGDDVIAELVGMFRNMYIARQKDKVPMAEKACLLHGVALIGVRSVTGVENATGSPFNVQRSMHIPNLTYDEVNEMYHWYQREHGQEIKQKVIDRIFYETQGQPGLVSFFGELLTETYNKEKTQPIEIRHWEKVFYDASSILPDNNIINLISKAKKEKYQSTVLQIFRTEKKIEFKFDNKKLNYLFMNGVIDYEEGSDGKNYAKFPCPYVQKRLFNYFSSGQYDDINPYIDPFDEMLDTFGETELNVRRLIGRYQDWLRLHPDAYDEAPLRKDLRVREVVYHFHIYQYLYQMFNNYGRIWAEFPTGNGKIDLLMTYNGKNYGLELKSFSTTKEYEKAIEQARAYALQLGISTIHLLFFVERIPDEHRKRLEKAITDKETHTTVDIIFVETEIEKQN